LQTRASEDKSKIASRNQYVELAPIQKNRDYPLNCVNEDLLLHFINHFPGQR
jgi:hypothetical protein